MDMEMQRRIEGAVLEILRGADMESITEAKVRAMAAERLGLDLSLSDRKRFVRAVVESFLSDRSQAHEETQPNRDQEEAVEEEEEDDEEEEEENTKKRRRGGEKEYDDDGDLIICRLSNKRRVTIQEFRGKTLVSIREYYEKGGKQLPTSKGISLTTDQWASFKKAVPDIENAIKKLEAELD